MGFNLAELNIAKLTAPLDDPSLHEFVSVLEAVNLIAEASAGFVWRLKDDDGRSSTFVPAFDDPLLIVNLTVWKSVEELKHFTYRSGHGAYFRRRTEWFVSSTSEMVCWWIPEGEVPDVADAKQRLGHLREHGPSQTGFFFSDPLAKPAA
jgi:Domain of unknown function (DUF3291)